MKREKQAQVNGRSLTIIGVMGKDFSDPIAPNLWEPLALSAEDKADRYHNYVFPVGLLKPGVSASQAAAELKGIGERLAKEFPKSNSLRYE